MERRNILKTLAALTISAGVGYGAKQMVEAIDSAFKPMYVVNSSSEPIPEPPPIWTPRTNWNRKIGRTP